MPSVLIVDDEPNIRRMVGALLASEGYDVREAPDGARGVALAVESEPDLALVDLMMPGELDGMGVLTALRERLGAKGRGFVERRYASSALAERLVRLLQGVASQR